MSHSRWCCCAGYHHGVMIFIFSARLTTSDDIHYNSTPSCDITQLAHSPLLCFSHASFPHVYVCLFFVFLVATGSKGLPGVPGYQGTHGLPGDPSTAKGQFGDSGAEGLPGIKGMPGLTGNRGISGFGGMPGYKVSRSLDGSSTKRSHRGLSPHPSLLSGSAGSVSVLRSTFAGAGFPRQLYKLSS